MAVGDADALIIDDGELKDLWTVLVDLGISVAGREDYESDAAVSFIPLLLTTPGHVRACEGRGARPRIGRNLHVVVAESLSRNAKQALDRLSCDFVVQRPVEPTVVRLLAQHALFEGPEKRSGTRVAIGAATVVKEGRRSLPAMLTQISPGGCGLVVRQTVAVRREVEVALPADSRAATALSVHGRVVGLRRVPAAKEESYDLSIAFGPLSQRARVRIKALMTGHSVELRPRKGPVHPARAASASARAGSGGTTATPDSERRGDARHQYQRQLLGGMASGSRTLLGRDLSRGGMRVARDPGLGIGDEVTLAVHGGARPVVIRAQVVRDDADEGWFLRFGRLSGAAATDLEGLLTSLPTIGPGSDGGSAGAGPSVVVSEVLKKRPG